MGVILGTVPVAGTILIDFFDTGPGLANQPRQQPSRHGTLLRRSFQVTLLNQDIDSAIRSQASASCLKMPSKRGIEAVSIENAYLFIDDSPKQLMNFCRSPGYVTEGIWESIVVKLRSDRLIRDRRRTQHCRFNGGGTPIMKQSLGRHQPRHHIALMNNVYV